MQRPRRLRLTDLNAHLTCTLCRGYLIDATTIIECLHSFCRRCIVRYLESNKYCPICDVQVHKTRPLLNIRPDVTLQNVVYKLVPGLFQSEVRRRREYYAQHPEQRRPPSPPAAAHIYAPDENVSVCLEYDSGSPAHRRYLRCPAAVSVLHLQKLLRAKHGLSAEHRVDILHRGERLQPDLTLMDVAYVYLWKRRGPLLLTYRMFEAVCDPHCNQPAAVTAPPPAPSWKEVQLQISENGVMSVTNIEEAPPAECVLPAAPAPKRKLPEPPPAELPAVKVRPAPTRDVQHLSRNHPLKLHARPVPAARPTAPKPPAAGYKTLRDPPRAWNPQLPKAASARPSTSESARPEPRPPPPKAAKFFKVRNNLPRYLGNPASGVKPLYQVCAAAGASTPDRDKDRDRERDRDKQRAVIINQSVVPIFNPLRARLDRRPPRKDKPSLTFTPSNPFVPNLSSPTLPPGQFVYPGFPAYDPRLGLPYPLPLGLSMLYPQPRLGFPGLPAELPLPPALVSGLLASADKDPRNGQRRPALPPADKKNGDAAGAPPGPAAPQ